MDVALLEITGYLDLKNLLQVRYLNIAWNEAAKHHMKKRYFSLRSKEEDVLKFADLVRTAAYRDFPTPFRKLNIDFLEQPNFYLLQDFIRQYGHLFTAYKITFVYHERWPTTVQAMIDIINHSPNLKMLEFYNISEQAVDILYPVLRLPKLTSLVFQNLPKTSGIYFLKTILEASPALKFLKICEIQVEMTSLISVLANTNIEIVMEKIYASSLPETSSFNGNLPINLTSVYFHNLIYNISPNLILSKKISEFIQQYAHTIKYLKIQNLNSKEDIQFPTMNVLETLYLNYYRHEERPQHLAKLYRGRFPSLKKLQLELDESWELFTHFSDSEIPLESAFLHVRFEDTAELNTLADTLSKFLTVHARKLKQLELIFHISRNVEDESEVLIRLPVDLPALEFLQIEAPINKTFQFGKTENVRKLMMDNGLEYNQIQLQFPNLKSLFIRLNVLDEIHNEFQDWYQLYTTPIGIEELSLELYSSHSDIPALDWRILTGVTSENEDFISEAMKMVHSNNLSLAQDLFKDSKPNIGNITSLQTLNIWGEEGNDAMAILFLVFCGKLKNLRKYRACIDPCDDFFHSSSTAVADVFTSNNTQFFPVADTFGLPNTFMEPFTLSDPFYLEV